MFFSFFQGQKKTFGIKSCIIFFYWRYLPEPFLYIHFASHHSIPMSVHLLRFTLNQGLSAYYFGTLKFIYSEAVSFVMTDIIFHFKWQIQMLFLFPVDLESLLCNMIFKRNIFHHSWISKFVFFFRQFITTNKGLKVF